MKILEYPDHIIIKCIWPNFDLDQIAGSGQCFRWSHQSNGSYIIPFKSSVLVAKNYESGSIHLNCSPKEFHKTWYNYLDLGYNYLEITRNLVNQNEDPYLNYAAMAGSGIRILNQDPWEMIISYIISQQNNIPRIRKIIERLCNTYGKLLYSTDKTDYYSFPSAQEIMSDPTRLDHLGLGFRTKYVISACTRVLNGYDIDNLRTLSYEECITELKSFYGIGDKIANCVALYSLGHKNAFPRDVWINRIIHDRYNDCFDLSKFGNYAGIIQQYMYYYERHSSR